MPIITTLMGGYCKARSELPFTGRIAGQEMAAASRPLRLDGQMVFMAAAPIGIAAFLSVYQIGNPTLNAVGLAPGRRDGSLQRSYELAANGYDIMTRNLNPGILANMKNGLRPAIKAAGLQMQSGSILPSRTDRGQKTRLAATG